MKDDIQIIGADLGRGFAKGYSEYNDRKLECMFRSVVGMGREIDFSNYDDPIYIEVDGEDYFAGDLAQNEAISPTANSRDSKASLTAEKLLYAMLNKIAITDKIKIMFGVPNKSFRKVVLAELQEKYKDKEVEIKDKISGATKKITIVDVGMFREADAALLWTVRNNKKNDRPIGMVTIGFRTTEFSYFDEGLKFNDKKSQTLETGNKTPLQYVQKIISKDNTMKELHQIDSSNKYDDIKEIGYKNLAESIEQQIEESWINLNEMDIFLAGGTTLNLKMDKMFTVVEDAQTCTAKGLYLIATKLLK